MRRSRIWFFVGRLLCATMPAIATVQSAHAQTPAALISEALQNITTLMRDGRVGYATFWDGNKFVQCRRLATGAMHCEAAGTLMQPSLRSVLTADRLKRLAALGWTLNPAFGNYVKDFAADVPTEQVADHILRTLADAYLADKLTLELNTKWVANGPCPPRAGFSQNLAGSVNDAPSMKRYAVRACSYVPDESDAQRAMNVGRLGIASTRSGTGSDARRTSNREELIGRYGAQVTSEIQRLRLNSARRVWIVFATGSGYIQCAPETPMTAIYCEAQSAESWPALAAVLTPDSVLKLKRAGYSDPGRAPNYSRRYAVDQFGDAAIASEILTVLHEVYGYTGAAKLKFKTE